MKERSFEQILEEMNDSVNKPNHYLVNMVWNPLMSSGTLQEI